MGFWDFLVPAELPYPGMPQRAGGSASSGGASTGAPGGAQPGNAASSTGAQGFLDKIFAPADLPYPRPVVAGQPQTGTALTPAGFAAALQAMEDAKALLCPAPAQPATTTTGSGSQPTTPATPLPSASSSPSTAMVTMPSSGSSTTSVAPAPTGGSATSPTASASAAALAPQSAQPAAASPVTVVIMQAPAAPSVAPIVPALPAATEQPSPATALPAPATSPAPAAPTPPLPAASAPAVPASSASSATLPAPATSARAVAVPVLAPVPPIVSPVCLPPLEKRLTAYCANPRLRARQPKAHEVYIEEVLEEVITTRMIEKNADPVAFAVPDGCNAVDFSIGPIEVDPVHGSADDLELVVTIGELQTDGVDEAGLTTGDQVIVTAPWRHASFVELAADHLRFPIFARFYVKDLTQ